ncbi:MAG: glycosyltransferase family 2 protein [Acidimicrobiales bacterium]|jgi:GT2 family glycosyltransferase
MPPSSLRVQTVAHAFTPATLLRYVEALAQSLHNARVAGLLGATVVALGDSSEKAGLSKRAQEELREALVYGGADFTYERFGRNLGHAEGHNRLFQTNDSELLLLCNDDVVAGPVAVTELIRGLLARPEVGLVEAHQLPFENPKAYDPVSGETGWCSLACALTRAELFAELGGLDAESFFVDGDDVDYSWRLRLAGYQCTYRPSARVILDQRVDGSGRLLVSPKNERSVAEADLLLSRKYGRPDHFEVRLAFYSEHGSEAQREAAEALRERKAEGRLPSPVAGADTVAFFRDGSYAVERFS